MFLALHIPDGFLTPGWCALGWVLALPFLFWAWKHTSRQLDEASVPLMGVLAAFTFVAQSLQFPIPGGTSAHLQGSALAALALGPANAILVLSVVIAVQALVFGDGGLLVMGWNLVNMAVVGGLTAWLAGAAGRRCRLPLAVWAFGAAWLSVEASTMATCFELAGSGASTLWASLPVMMGAQALVGVGEGMATVGALTLLKSRQPGFSGA